MSDYIEAATDFVDGFETQILQLEEQIGRPIDAQVIGQILGDLHTFKGNSGMLSLGSVEDYAHTLEDLFNAIASDKLALNEATIELALRSTRILRRALECLPDHSEKINLSDEISRIHAFVARAGAKPGPAASAVADRVVGSDAVKRTNTLKVDFQRLDHLLNLMGELVIWRTRLGRIGARLLENFGEKGPVLEVSDTAEQIGKLTT